jgi:hypothetical protein
MRKRLGLLLLVLIAPGAFAQHSQVKARELPCVGFIHESELPLDLLVMGTEYEGVTAFLTAGSLVYAGGPALSSAKVGEVFQVIRPEGKIRDSYTREAVGIYYKELGTIRLEAIHPDSATGTVLTSCAPMVKGDLLVAMRPKGPVTFSGTLSDRLTPYPAEGVASSILVGKDDAREMAAGFFCFIGVGASEGVRAGDRFTIYRPQPGFDRKDLIVNAAHGGTSYGKWQTPVYEARIVEILKKRNLPPRVVGDLVVVDVAETTAAAKIIQSRSEVHIGDLVVRR